MVMLLLFCLLADEGMWPYNQFPVDAIKQKYSFDATARLSIAFAWASVEIGGVKSGSFCFAKRSAAHESTPGFKLPWAIGRKMDFTIIRWR